MNVVALPCPGHITATTFVTYGFRSTVRRPFRTDVR